MRSIFTDQGLNAIITASVLGPKLEINGVKVSSDLIDPNLVNVGAYTNLNNIVWSGGIANIRYQAKTDTGTNKKVIIYVVTLDELVPTIDFGTIGLYNNDTLISVTCLDKMEHRETGDRNVYDIMFGINGSAEAMAIDVILPAESSIPYITSTAGLPSIIESPYNAYSCGVHEEYGIPCIAARGTSEWQFYFPNASTDGLPSDNWASNVDIGNLVYFNPISGQLEKAQPTTGALGFRGNKNNLVTHGIYIDPALELMPGLYYYVGSNGNLTTEVNNYLVGQAVNESTLYIGIFPETVKNKIDQIDLTRASNVKYLSELAIKNLLNASITVEGDWTFTKAKLLWQ